MIPAITSGKTKTLNICETICISTGFESNTGTINANIQAKAVIILNCLDLVSNSPD
jgi:hypothetical protein